MVPLVLRQTKPPLDQPRNTLLPLSLHFPCTEQALEDVRKHLVNTGGIACWVPRTNYVLTPEAIPDDHPGKKARSRYLYRYWDLNEDVGGE